LYLKHEIGSFDGLEAWELVFVEYVKHLLVIYLFELVCLGLSTDQVTSHRSSHTQVLPWVFFYALFLFLVPAITSFLILISINILFLF